MRVAGVDPEPTVYKPEEREVEQPQVMQEAEMRVAGVDPEPTVYKPEEKGIEDVEVIHESDIQKVESRIGEITYHLDENGNYNVGGNISVAKDMTSYNALQSGMMQKDMAENPDMEMTNAYQTKLQMKSMEVMLRNEIYTDLQNRLNLGEEVPGAQEFMQKHEEELRNLGLSRDEHGGIGRIADEQQRTTQQTEERPVERPVTKEEKVEEQPVEKPVEKEEKIFSGALNYGFTAEGDLNISGNVAINEDSEAYKVAKEAIMASNNKNDAIFGSMFQNDEIGAELDTHNLVVANEVYSNLQQQEAEGTALSAEEKMFIHKHEQKLADLGLGRDENGNICKAENVPQQTAEKVEEKPAEKPVEKEEKVEEQPVEKPVEKEEKIFSGALNYGFTAEGDLNISGNVAINEDSEAYKVAKEAIMASNNKNDAIFGSMFQNDEIGAELDTHNLVVANEVYSNLQQQEAEGTALSAEEKMFIHKHEQKLADLGLGRDENGNICKAEDVPQQTAEKVEEKPAEKPVEKEGKEDAAQKAAEARIRQVAQIYGKRNGLEGEALQEFIDKQVKEHMPQEQVVTEAPKRHTIESKMGIEDEKKNIFQKIFKGIDR